MRGHGVSVLDYDANQRVQLSVPEQANRELDRWGNVILSRDVRNAAWTTQYLYNDKNQVVEKMSAPVTTYRYEGEHNLVAQVVRTRHYSAYDALGNLTESVDANGNKTIRTYNGLGSLVQERYADGGRVDYNVDVFGQRVQMTQVAIDIQNIVTNFSYDRKGNVVDRWFENVSLGEVNGDMSTNGYAGGHARGIAL